MAKIKGWKKPKIERSGKLLTFKLIGEPEYYMDVTESHDILVYKREGEIDGVYHNWGWEVHSLMFGDKKFKTKSKALAFARAYMKKHPKG